jgi:hypothetical protein
LEIDELRQLLTEVAVCVVQSGNEIAGVAELMYDIEIESKNDKKQ